MERISRKYFEWFKQKHYELWDWLNKNPDKIKDDWFNSVYYVGTPKLDIKNSCFACELARQIRKYNFDKPMCEYCPICKRIGSCLNGLFNEYLGATNNLKRMELAKQIRDLPWSEEYVEEKEMNNENYIVINGKKAELTEEQLKQLGIEVNKNKRERVKVGDMFFSVDRDNCIDSCFDTRLALLDYCYDTHNYFKTKEEAQKYAEVLEVKRQLMKFADEHNKKIDWDKLNEPKYYLYLTRPTDGIIISNTYRAKIPEIIYFSSTDIAQKAIDTIGAENIIKYLIYNY